MQRRLGRRYDMTGAVHGEAKAARGEKQMIKLGGERQQSSGGRSTGYYFTGLDLSLSWPTARSLSVHKASTIVVLVARSASSPRMLRRCVGAIPRTLQICNCSVPMRAPRKIDIPA